MKQFYFFGFWLSVFVFLNLNTVYSKTTILFNPILEKPIKTTDIAYFTDLKGFCFLSPSYEKLPYSQNLSPINLSPNYSLQRDTSKKKLNIPDKGLGIAQKQQKSTNEIDGLLLDATFSPGGYDFYLQFSQYWTPPNGAFDYTILVKEYPGRGVNIVVAIEINGKQLVYRRMRPIYPSIDGLALAAANYLTAYVARGDHLRGIDADGNFIDVQRTDVTRRIKTPFDIY